MSNGRHHMPPPALSLVAPCAIAVAAGLSWLVHPELGPNVLLFFLAAVLASAWYGGVGSGLLATALAVPVIDYGLAGALDAPNLPVTPRLGLFVLVALLATALVGRRRRDVAALRRSEAHLRRLVESNVVGVFVGDPTTGLITEANDAFLAMLGYTEEELASGRVLWKDLTPVSDPEADRAKLEAVFRNDGYPPEESEYIRRDGRRINVLVGAAPLDGSRLVCLLVDTTEAKRAARRLSVQHVVTCVLAEAVTMTEAAPRLLKALCDGFGWDVGTLWMIDPDSHRLRCAHVCERPGVEVGGSFTQVTLTTTFREGEGLLGRVWTSGEPAWFAGIPAELAERIPFPRTRAIVEAQIRSLVAFPIVLGTDVCGVIELLDREVKAPDEALLATLGTIGSQLGQFVQRKLASEALAASEQRFRVLCTAAPLGILQSDAEGRCVYANPRWEEISGLRVAESLGYGWAEAVHPEDRVQVFESLWKARAAGRPWSSEYRLRTRAGETRWVRGLAGPVLSAAGSPTAFVATVEDVTERKATEAHTAHLLEQLRSQESWLEAVLNLLPTPLVFVEPGTGRATFANRAADAFAGRRFPLGRSTADYERAVVCTDASGAVIQRGEYPTMRVARGERLEGVEVNWRYEGKPRSLLVWADLLPAMHGHSATAVAVLQDVSRLKSVEAELRRADAAKDEFVAAVSHELRSPLAAIRMWTRLLRGQLADSKSAAQALDGIEHSTLMQTRLVEDLLDVSRIIAGKMALSVRPVDLRTVVDAAVDAVRADAAATGVRLELVDEGTLARVAGDAARLQQVVWNLLSNAVKFSHAGGRVTVRLGSAGGEALLSVSDEGEGIAPDFLPHVFERFRQAADDAPDARSGLGLGLAIVRHLVELHGGSATAESEGLGRGATFTIRLPFAAAQVEPAPEPVAGGRRPPVRIGVSRRQGVLAGVRVLVVDDDPAAGERAAAVLADAGATVEIAASAGEAARRVAIDPPHVLVSELAVEDGPGAEVIRRVRAAGAREGIPALALTRRATSDDRRSAEAAGFAAHLAKPATPGELVEAVEALAVRSRRT